MAGKRIEYSGQTINGWKILGRTDRKYGRSTLFKAVCEKCGLEKENTIGNFRKAVTDCRYGHKKGHDSPPRVYTKELIGKRFNSWLVLRLDTVTEYREPKFLCECECGVVKSVYAKNFVNGTSKSCRSCSAIARDYSYLMTHGHTANGEVSPTFSSWASMVARCHSPSALRLYPHYAGKGIKVCDRWRYSFQNFLDDMGERPEGTSVDRIDSKGNYEPANCRWVNQSIQVRDQKRPVIVDGQKFLSILDTAKFFNITPSSVCWRIVSQHFPGWSWMED